MPQKYARLTPEDEKAFLDALDSIWDAIGMDCLASTAECKGIGKKSTEYGTLYPAEQVTLPRSHVIDIVTDQFAGGMLQNHGPKSGQMPQEQFKRIREWMIATPARIVDKIVAVRFHYKRYGA